MAAALEATSRGGRRWPGPALTTKEKGWGGCDPLDLHSPPGFCSPHPAPWPKGGETGCSKVVEVPGAHLDHWRARERADCRVTHRHCLPLSFVLLTEWECKFLRLDKAGTQPPHTHMGKDAPLTPPGCKSWHWLRTPQLGPVILVTSTRHLPGPGSQQSHHQCSPQSLLGDLLW